MNKHNAALILDFMQVGGHGLTQGEYRTTLFALNFTIGWDKLADEIPLHRFLNGHCSRAGQAYLSGCGMSKHTIQRAIKSISEKLGFFKITVGDNNVHMFSVQVENIKKHIKMAKLKIAKKFNELRNDEGGVPNRTGKGCQMRHTPSPIDPPLVSSSSLRSEGRDAAPAETAVKAVERIQQQHRSTRDDKIKAISTTRPTRDNLTTAFQAAYLKHHDGKPDLSLTRAAWGNYKNHFLGRKKEHFPEGFDYVQFFEDVIHYWPALSKNVLHWANDIREQPTLIHFCRFCTKLYEYYIASGNRSLSTRFIEDGVHRHVYEDVCKSNAELKQEVSNLRDQVPSYTDQLRANNYQRREQQLVAETENLNRKVKALQMKNAKLRRNGGHDSAETIPTFEEIEKHKER